VFLEIFQQASNAPLDGSRTPSDANWMSVGLYVVMAAPSTWPTPKGPSRGTELRFALWDQFRLN
jgi:hypothetical protein